MYKNMPKLYKGWLPLCWVACWKSYSFWRNKKFNVKLAFLFFELLS